MKKMITVLTLIFAQNASALSQEAFGECIFNNESNVQTLIGLLQPMIGEEIVSGEQVTFSIQDDSVTTCLDAEVVLVEYYAKGLKIKKENAAQ